MRRRSRAVRACGSTTLARAMRRRTSVAAVLVALLALLVLTACDPPGRKEKQVSPLPETVEGTLPKNQPTLTKGDPAKGKSLYAAQGCGGCHAFTPAGSSARVGPDLDELEQHAEEANQGPLPVYTSTSIKNPGAYLVPGYENVMPPYATLKDEQVADLVAFLTNKG